jgi:hypothetical protein
MEELRQWLIDNNCYEQWCRDVRNGGDFDEALYALIDSPFTWEETPEGHSYWDNLHRKAPDVPRKARGHIGNILKFFESLDAPPELLAMERLKKWRL